jgi:hypothetical protein
MERTIPPPKPEVEIRRRKYKLPMTGFEISLSPEERPKGVTQPNPPRDLIMRRGEYWCPYCAQASRFEMDPNFQILRCPRCGISEKDYYVKNANHLWGKKE